MHEGSDLCNRDIGETIHHSNVDRQETRMAVRSRPTIIDVAKRVGVSPTTVSYVLSGPKERADRISDETSARIRRAVEEVGYVPNQSARTLRLMRTHRILFLGNRISSLFSQAMADSIQRRLGKYDLALNVQVGSGKDSILAVVETLAQNHADGLIVETGDEYLPELREAAERGHAIVAIGPSGPEPTFDVMSHDLVPAIRNAMNHIDEQGYRRVILLSRCRQPLDDYRIRIAHEALLSQGRDHADITMLLCPHDRIGAYHAALEFLSDYASPVAVYAGSDVSAIGVLWATIHKGLNVPEQVGIIGHGNSPETEITVPPLTSIGPLALDFSQAADLIAARIRNPSRPGQYTSQPCQLSVRESTAANSAHQLFHQERRFSASRT